jgi:hypothetical protein
MPMGSRARGTGPGRENQLPPETDKSFLVLFCKKELFLAFALLIFQ